MSKEEKTALFTIFDISGGWPCGVSNGLRLNCGVCDGHTNFDFGVTDELWKAVVPEDLRLGVVCLDCLDILAKKKGFLLSKHLKFVQYTGKGETIILKPHTSFIYRNNRKN